ncbi:mRNA-decapping enzyme subunit 2 [Geranomyces variabilis]|uniref:mRNA-decapping enzyme subunit 2 n=1 Tax=Geranomyces variabilis TaxID=109894 RepID=A0AAD5TEG8_9FUNG|nr:mRNA-decapping enzyme subunit 2 [Geranomyces variabilis]
MSFQTLSFQEVLDDLQSRFIINVPKEELSSVERICFQIEQAHWFYEDFVREENPRLSSFGLKNFCAQFFRHCPLLHRWAHDHEKAFQNFMEYKVRVPVCGAIILNESMDKVLLVKGWKSSSGWGFPKGKINKDEPEAPCAIREVQEETGFDIGPYLRVNEYVERTIKGQRIRLYILTGVPEDTVFSPQTRKEIGDIRWHRLDDLPGWNKNAVVEAGERRNKFYMVTAFVSGLRQWMAKYRKAKRQGKARNGRHLSVVLGYNTGTDSEGEGGNYSDAGFRSGTEGTQVARPLPSVLENASRTVVVVEPDDDEMVVAPIDPYAAAQSIRALIGIGGPAQGSNGNAHAPAAVGVRVDVQSNGGTGQPIPQVAIGVSFDNTRHPHHQHQQHAHPQYQIVNQHHSAPQLQNVPHMTSSSPINRDSGAGSPAYEAPRGVHMPPPPPPSMHRPEPRQQYEAPAPRHHQQAYALQASSFETPQYQQQRAHPPPPQPSNQYPDSQYLAQPPQQPPQQAAFPPHPHRLQPQNRMPSSGTERQAHKKSLLDILTKGTSDESLATGSTTSMFSSQLGAGGGGHILPNPPQHPSFRPPTSGYLSSPYTEAPALGPTPPRRESVASNVPSGVKQQMFMDILRGGSFSQSAPSLPSTTPRASVGPGDGGDESAAAEDQLKSILGIGRMSVGSGSTTSRPAVHQMPPPPGSSQYALNSQPPYPSYPIDRRNGPAPSQHQDGQHQQQAQELKALLGLGGGHIGAGSAPPPHREPSGDYQQQQQQQQQDHQQGYTPVYLQPGPPRQQFAQHQQPQHQQQHYPPPQNQPSGYPQQPYYQQPVQYRYPVPGAARGESDSTLPAVDGNRGDDGMAAGVPPSVMMRAASGPVSAK